MCSQPSDTIIYTDDDSWALYSLDWKANRFLIGNELHWNVIIYELNLFRITFDAYHCVLRAFGTTNGQFSGLNVQVNHILF
jgi:hypothetical protein